MQYTDSSTMIPEASYVKTTYKNTSNIIWNEQQQKKLSIQLHHKFKQRWNNNNSKSNANAHSSTMVTFILQLC